MLPQRRKSVFTIFIALFAVSLPALGSDWKNLSRVTVADAGGSDRAPSETIDFRASAVNGQASVSGGAAVFSVPIDIPPGRNGMQPAVSLDYSSRSGPGIAGVGWSVTAGSALHRCDTTVAQEGQSRAVIMSASDRLCLDGQKLMAVSGQYGTSGAQYRTELDQFVRVTQYGALTSATTYFVVERKDNIVATYGGTTDSRHIALGHTLPMTWAINKQQDRAGNTLTYTYLNAGSGEYVLSAIDYTGYQSSVGNRKVAFQYETRPDQARHYLAGGLIRSTLRLKAIESQLDSIPLRRYELAYDTSSHTQRSLLQSIKECYQGQCKAATDLRSYAPLLAWDSRDSSSSAHRVISPVAGNGRHDQTRQMDLNGDGIQELVHLSAQYDRTDKLISYLVKIYQRQASGDYTLAYDASAQSSDIANGIFYYPQGDLNGDGISDFFIVNRTSGQVSLFQFNQDLVPQPLIPTNVILPSAFWTNPSGVGATLQILDLNGDGQQDFAFIGADHKVYYYQHQGGVTPSFSGPHLLTTRSKTTYEGKSYLEQIRYMDMDGDGVMDVVKTLRLANASEQISVQFGSISSSGLLTLGTAVSSATLGLPTNHVNNEYVFADINGDGLSDYIRALQVGSSFSWQVRENRGNRTFSPERSLGTGTGIHAYQAYQNGTTRIQSRWGGLRVADIDSDGVDELLVATHSQDNVCVRFSGNPSNSGSQEPYHVTVCNDDLHRSEVNLSSHPWLEIDIDWSRYDARRFHWTVLDFKDSSVGATIGREIPNVVYAPIQSLFIRNGDRSLGLMINDIDNNGFADFSYQMITNYNQIAGRGQYINVAGQPYYYANLSMYFASGSPPYAGGYFEQYNQAGEGTDRGKLVDTVYEVQDGLGKSYRWDYAPLSRVLTGRIESTPFYQVPSERYIDNDPSRTHFYFTSSMYVVSDSFSDNGRGGTRQTQYHYREAIYNRAGRGFQGFRAIIADDVDRGLRSIHEYHQLFPLTGKLQESRVCLSSEPEYACKQTPLVREQIDYDTLVTTPTGTQWVYPVSAVKQRWDLQGIPLSKTETQVNPSDVDAWGNISKQTQTVTDYIKGQANTYSSMIETSFAVDVNNWWLNKFNWTRTTHNAAQRNWGDDPVGTMDKAQWQLQTVSTWDSVHRLPIKMTYTASNSSCNRIEETGLNSYGLPLWTKTTGQSSTCSSLPARQTSFTYTKDGTTQADDGYLPYKVTNAKGHITTTEYDMGLGLPTKVIAPNNIITQTEYDGIGRPVQVKQTGSPTRYLRYLLANEGNNPPQDNDNIPVVMTRTSGAGIPETEQYVDGQGRLLRTATQGFDGGYQYQDKHYDALGRLIRESTPYGNGTAADYTEFSDFDALDRPGRRTIPNGRSGGLESLYTYNGLTTDINVEGRLMSRTYGSQGWLYETVDAQNGTNRFAYDSAGRPLVIRDANNSDIKATYNGFGHKTQVIDPNQGTTVFGYNSVGELDKQTDANGVVQTYVLDVLGRVTSKTTTGGSAPSTATFVWDTLKQGLLTSETENGVARTYAYTTALQLAQTTVTVDSTSRTVKHQYDGFYGRPKAMEYPNGLTLKYVYNDYGYLEQTSNAASGYVYRHITAMDEAGHITGADLANRAMSESRSYYSEGTMASVEVDGPLGRIHAHYYDGYDEFMNLISERNGVTGLNKSYRYDTLNRLTEYQFNNTNPTFSATVNYAYDKVGNFLKKTDYSANSTTAYRYGGSASCAAGNNAGPNAVCQLTKLNGTTVSFQYDNRGNLRVGDGLSMTYNAMDKPLSVSGRGATTSFVYGSDNIRAKQNRTVGNTTTTTYYVDKYYEADSDGSWRAYLDDIAVLSYTPQRGHLLQFTLKDRLGSATTLADQNGNIVSQRYFDPFGRTASTGGGHRTDMANKNTLQSKLQDLDINNKNRRGFTNHEHLNEQQLIHMNGRIYDYNLGRFMSVDPFIQSPTSTQSVNPYSYIMNNPLAGIDPTGYYAECPNNINGCPKPEEKKRRMDGSGRGSGWTVIYDISGNGSNRQSSLAKGTQKTEAIGSPKQNANKSWGSGTSGGNNPSVDSTNREAVEFNGTETACVGGGAACTPSSQSVNISLGYTDTPVGMGTNHALVIVTDPLTGEQYATRAGPSLFKTDEGGSGVGLGTIRAESGVYDKTFRDSPDKVHTTQHVGKIKITFAEAVSRMHEFAKVTNSNSIPYKPSFNSNSYAFTFVESLGFKRPTPKVWSPGWESGRADTKKLSYLK
ncbi:FG-GAP-like repeat-containing protein [Shewanella sp. YIC-542]|uniref:FG-GAP-like repeat-containing protein n=1 Tax=Shewanella mytili TaxID=3377111 RepID=UPI00398E9902